MKQYILFLLLNVGVAGAMDRPSKESPMVAYQIKKDNEQSHFSFLINTAGRIKDVCISFFKAIHRVVLAAHDDNRELVESIFKVKLNNNSIFKRP